MKEQQLQPRTKPTSSSPELQKPKSENEPKLQRVNVETLVDPLTNPSKVREENSMVFGAAEGERKVVNLEKMKEYMGRRVESYQERVRICQMIKSMFFQKQKNTKAFLKNMMRYFEDYAELYSSLYKSLGKLELKKKYQGTTMYASVKQSIAELVKLNDEESEHVQKFVDWLEKILAEAFKSAYNYFRERMKKINKDLESSQLKYYQSWSRQQKTYQSLPQSKDLLQKQLSLIEQIKTTNESAIARSLDLHQAWQSLLQQQNTIKRLLKDNIVQFHDRFIKFHKKTDSANAILKIWSNIPLSANAVTVYSSFLDQKSLEYINYGGKTKKIGDNFQAFMKMVYEEKRIGNPEPYLDYLIVKKFIAKLRLTDRQWKDIKLIFSVDKNLLFYDTKQSKVFLKLFESSLKLKRISENIIELNGIQQGVIFDSKKKQSIHFETLDLVEEFVYYIQQIPEQKKAEK